MTAIFHLMGPVQLRLGLISLNNVSPSFYHNHRNLRDADRG
jgi:hypothetical protein